MPANIELSGLEVSLVNTMSRETILKQYLDTVKHKYDYVLIDCMSNLGMLTLNALAASDNVMIPVQAQYLSAKGLEQLLQTINKVRRQINPKLKIEGILLTMVDSRTNNAKEIAALIRDTYGGKLKVYRTDITEDLDSFEVMAEKDWDNHDIEVFENGKLIYLNRNISYIRHIQFSFSMDGRKKRIPLKTLKDYEVEIKGKPQVSSVGEPPEPVQKMLGEYNQELVLSLRKQKSSETFQFFQPGEVERAKYKIMEMMESAVDELWIFDSYFTDKSSGSNVMLDWLRMSMATNAKRKNIIFYCKDISRALDVDGLKDEILRDEILQVIKDARKTLGVRLVQTIAPIHDRFLIVRNGDTYTGLAIGTSFNSLNSNHYCMQKIAHREAEGIISMLTEWMLNNTAEIEEI